MTTKIEWCDETINPVAGCSKCSPGCDNCYAEKMAYRLSRMPQTAAKYRSVVNNKGKWTGFVSKLDLSVFDRLPNKPRSVFVGSMTDLFHPSTLFKFSLILDKISENRRHTFLILTKRTQNMRSSLSPHFGKIPENLWLGTTVCNQKEAEKNIPIIQQIPTARTFISIEPMIGPIDLAKACLSHIMPPKFVIVGGETGPGSRPMHPDWVRNIRDQCAAAGVPFFFKGWGKHIPCHRNIKNCNIMNICEFLDIDGAGDYRPPKKCRLLDGVEYNERPW